jgi:hypothetical protein
MKTIKGASVILAIIAAMAASATNSKAQTNLNFNNVSATVEGAILLSWNSTPNEYYEIDYADSLIDTNTGTITWNLLYEDYPAQGTNTIWLDTGSYFVDPIVEHPSKTAMRFYRIVLSGTNDIPGPAVSITSPAGGYSAFGDINVTVSANSVQPFISTKLYVDGQEMQEASSVTNYVNNGTNFVVATYLLNTCEWPNGSHKLFATAQCQSGPSGTHDFPTPLIGRGVSPFVSGSFSNLITRVAFSQPFFMPEDGQTQRVSAVFAANVNWTLQIQDASTNTVRTATGSGGSMVFTWDGTGAGGTNLPVGNYTYLVSAETNGLPLPQNGGGGPINTNFPPLGGSRMATISNEDGTTTTIDWYPICPQEAIEAGWSFYYLRPPPMPPVKTNGVWVPWKDVFGPKPLIQVPVSSATLTSASFQQDGPTPNFSGPSSQSTRSPVRPPTTPTKGQAGFFGVAYDTYRGVASGYTLPPPLNGLPGLPPPHLELEGHTVSGSTFNYASLMRTITEARNFIKEMKHGNWAMSFDRFDDALTINDLRGSGANIFNSVKIGLLLLHGTYGSSEDWTANGCQQMYFPITAGASAQYLRMSEMNLGSSDTNGLKWMAIDACNSLYEPNWNNMQNYGVSPFNGNLHLLLGTDSVSWTDAQIHANWAKYMTRGKIVLTPMTIQDAWFTAARDAFGATGFNYTNAITFAVAGDSACANDTLQNNTAPSGNPSYYNSQQVWP